MACRREEHGLEQRSISDALIMTTMCIIGMPVDVHAVDGSVYSGIFHTACVDKEYAIVLKNATMIKKGNLDANVVDGTVIGTLVVRSKDLLQVVVKGVVPSVYAEVLKLNEPKEKNGHLYQSRQVADGPQEIQCNSSYNPEFQDQTAMDEVQGSSPSITSFEAQSTYDMDIPEGSIQQEPNEVSSGCSSSPIDQDQGRPIPNEIACIDASPPDISDASVPLLEVESDSRLSASPDPFLWVSPKSPGAKKTAKESKLNRGAQRFYPSMLYHRMVAPHVDPNGASFPYRPGACTFASMGNVAPGHGDNKTPYFQPMIGQAVDSVQPPVMYTGQYQQFQTGPAYIHQNPQNGMFGRGGRPLLYANPIPSPAAGLSPATPRPLLAPHQLYLCEHHGNWSPQELQHYMNPPLVTNGLQPYLMPGPVHPVLPFARPTTIQGTHGYLSTKFV